MRRRRDHNTLVLEVVLFGICLAFCVVLVKEWADKHRIVWNWPDAPKVERKFLP